MCQTCKMSGPETALKKGYTQAVRSARLVLLSAGVQRKALRALSDEAARAELAAVDRLKEVVLNEAVDRLAQLWRRVGEEAAERAEEVLSLSPMFEGRAYPIRNDVLAEELLSYDDLVASLQDIVDEETRKAIREGFRSGQLRLDRTDIRLDFESPRVSDGLDRIVRQVEESALTASDDVVRVVQRGLADGDTTQDIASRVNEVLGGQSRDRAWKIASTSANSGFEIAQMEAYESADIERKGWLSTRDEAVRDTHIAADGQERELDEPFVVGGAALMHPGDPAGPVEEIVRCRCTSRPIVSQSVAV